MKSYKELKENPFENSSGKVIGFSRKSRDRLLMLEVDPIDTMFDDLFLTLSEGSGVITNSISIGMVKNLKKTYDEIKRTRDVGKKCDLLSSMMMVVGGLQLVTIGVSGDKKGLLSKGMSLLSIVTSLRTTRR